MLETSGNVRYVEGIVDRSGAHGIYVYDGGLGSSDCLFMPEASRREFLVKLFSDERIEKVVFGWTSLRRCGLTSLKNVRSVTDIETAFGGGDDLSTLVRRELTESDYVGLIEAASRFDAHITAAEVARVPLRSVPASSLMPPGFFEGFYRMRAVRALALRARMPQRASCEPSLIDRLSHVMSGPEIDGFVRDGKMVYPRFNVVGGKTRRIGHKRGSFNCMNVKHGEERAKFTSRFEGGKIVSIDFNAIDYRCIVNAIPRLRDLYDGCDDFHARTVEVITGKRDVTPDLRNAFKGLTYVHFYGGSIESCRRLTLLSREHIERLLRLFSERLADVETLRSLLTSGSMPTLPDDMERPQVELAEHPGARLAYFAQTCSSHAFKHAVVALCEVLTYLSAKSVLMFTVHDEVLIDCHPDEHHHMLIVQDVMEEAASRAFGTRFVTKMKMGESYADV